MILLPSLMLILMSLSEMYSMLRRSFALSGCKMKPTPCFAQSSLFTPLQMRTKLECISFIPFSFFLVSAIPRIEILRWFMNSTISGSLLVKPQTFQVPICRHPFSSPDSFRF